MRLSFVLSLLILVTFSNCMNVDTSSQDICVKNECSQLISTDILKECFENCKNFELQCIQSCISSLYKNDVLQRVNSCFEDNIITLKKLLTVGVSGECTAQLRYECKPYIDDKCPRRCLQNWVPTDCIPCTYDYC